MPSSVQKVFNGDQLGQKMQWHACVSHLQWMVLAFAEKDVQEQADHVRHMKEVDKLEKGDPVLDEAIAELLKRKDVLQRLQ